MKEVSISYRLAGTLYSAESDNISMLFYKSGILRSIGPIVNGEKCGLFYKFGDAGLNEKNSPILIVYGLANTDYLKVMGTIRVWKYDK